MERHILLIDDDEDEFLILSEVIDTMAGVKCSYAGNSRNGIEILKTGLPDVVLLDMNMPAVNGLQCLEYIKQIQQICHIPVFLYSTGFADTFRAEAHSLGAAGWLQKTTSHSALHDLIVGVLKLTACDTSKLRQGKGNL